jgi:hypothetical protein
MSGIARAQIDWLGGSGQQRSGRQIKQAAIAKVLSHSAERWRESYKAAVAQWFAELGGGATFTGEDLRLAALRSGMEHPHHCNAWGGMSTGTISAWLRDELIVVDGHAQAADPKARARLYPRYRKVGAETLVGN